MENTIMNRMANTGAQALDSEEMRMAAGGSFIDDALCALAGHRWENVEDCGRCGSPVVYKKWECTRCGKIKYEKRTPGSGIIVIITEEEYNAVMGC